MTTGFNHVTNGHSRSFYTTHEHTQSLLHLLQKTLKRTMRQPATQ